MPEEIHPIKLQGNWEVGYALDVHTYGSQLLGTDDYGQKVFDTERSPMGKLLYRLKYRYDQSVIPEIVRLVASFAPFRTIDVIVPVPPSHTGRPFQPVVEVARALGDKFSIPVLTEAVKKVKETPELKNVADFKERKRLLLFAFKVQQPEAVAGKTVLLFDDIYRSGATLSLLTWVLYHEAQAASFKVLTLTGTRSET